MRTKVTLVLLFLNVALFFFIFYLRHQRPVLDIDSNRVLGPEAANIQALELKTGDTPVFKLEQRGDAWTLVQPIEWPANEFAVKRIISELQHLRPDATFAVKDLGLNGQTLADYGLEKPPLTLLFTPTPPAPGSPAPKPIALRIGDAAKVGNRLYILSPDGDRVHVVNRSLLESLSVKLADLRADAIFTIPVFEARFLNIQVQPTATIPIRHDPDGRWFFEAPLRARASKVATDLAVNSLNGLRVKSLVLDARSADPAKTGLNTPSIRLSLQGNKRTETLLLGAPAATAPEASPYVEYFARMESDNKQSSPVFTVDIPVQLLQTLRGAQVELRDPRILDVDPATITALTLSARAQAEVTLQKLEGSDPQSANSVWQIVRRSETSGPQTTPADRTVVERLLQTITGLTALNFVSDAPSGADLENFGFSSRPARQITLSVVSAASASNAPAVSQIVLQLGTSGGNDTSVYAKLQGQNSVYKISAEILDALAVDPLVYRERLINELPAGTQIVGLKVTDVSQEKVLLETPWPIPAANSLLNTAQRQASETIVANVRRLRAKRFIREDFPKTVFVAGEDRPWKYRLDVTLNRLAGGNGAQTIVSQLYFTERVGGGTQLVGAPEYNVVFEAEQPLLDAIFAVTYGPRDPGPTLPAPVPTPTGVPASAATNP